MKKIYFASDFHFGLDYDIPTNEREQRFVKWLTEIKDNCAELYLLGDVFDYWFEYNNVVPKGFVRVLGKLAEFSDAGIPVTLFTGNHDIWMFGYMEQEIGIRVIHKECEMEIAGKKFLLGHGDGLGDPSRSFRFVRAFFRNKPCQWLYKWIHPDVTMPFGHWWSRHNRMKKKGNEAENYLGEDKEYLVKFSKETEKTIHHDYYMYGHRHIELDLMINKNSRVIILGDWISNFTFGVLDPEDGSFYLDNYIDQIDRASCCDLSDVC